MSDKLQKVITTKIYTFDGSDFTLGDANWYAKTIDISNDIAMYGSVIGIITTARYNSVSLGLFAGSELTARKLSGDTNVYVLITVTFAKL